jgi:hypothetical protein
MLREGTYRTKISISFELSRVYTTPVVRLWYMIVICNDLLDFRNLVLGLSVTLPHRRGAQVGLLQLFPSKFV